MFDCLGRGGIPPQRNTAWNKGRKCFHCLGAPNNLIRPCPGCQKSHRTNKVRSMGFCHACDMLQLWWISVSALQCCRERNLLTTRQAKQKKNPCRGNILHLLQQINSKQLAHVKNIMATVFWGHKCVLRCYAVTAECCGKRGRLPETIPCQTPGLLRPDVVILYDNARTHNAAWNLYFVTVRQLEGYWTPSTFPISRPVILTFWRRNFLLNFSTPCI